MNFGEKLSKAIKTIKGKLIVSVILWLVLTIVFVAPFALALHSAMTQVENSSKWSTLFMTLGQQIVKPLESIGLCIAGESDGYFFGILWRYTLIYAAIATVGIMKAMPKHEFDGIENGSSDWCVNGEQYSILNNKDGIILAEKNYLPVDKRGNVNVLVVGRFRFW